MRITYICREFHQLPLEGGVFDQKDIHLKKIEAVLRAQSEYERLNQGPKDGVQNKRT